MTQCSAASFEAVGGTVSIFSDYRKHNPNFIDRWSGAVNEDDWKRKCTEGCLVPPVSFSCLTDIHSLKKLNTRKPRSRVNTRWGSHMFTGPLSFSVAVAVKN